MFALVEYSRSMEATNAVKSIREAMERCYLMNNDYSSCLTFNDLDIVSPGSDAAAHFTYDMATSGSYFQITAYRNTYDEAITAIPYHTITIPSP